MSVKRRYKPSDLYPAHNDVVIVKMVGYNRPRWGTFTMKNIWSIQYPDAFDGDIEWWMHHPEPPDHARKYSDLGNNLTDEELERYGLSEFKEFELRT